MDVYSGCKVACCPKLSRVRFSGNNFSKKPIPCTDPQNYSTFPLLLPHTIDQPKFLK